MTAECKGIVDIAKQAMAGLHGDAYYEIIAEFKQAKAEARRMQAERFDKAAKSGGDVRARMRELSGMIRAAAADGRLDKCRTLLDELKAEAAKLPEAYAGMRQAVDAFKRFTA